MTPMFSMQYGNESGTPALRPAQANEFSAPKNQFAAKHTYETPLLQAAQDFVRTDYPPAIVSLIYEAIPFPIINPALKKT